jgi:hypothetical protein
MTVAATRLITLVVAQASAREIDMTVTEHRNNMKRELIDTFIRSQDDKLKETCNWCRYQNHHEKNCQQKVVEKLRKEGITTTPSYGDGKKIIRCFCCGCTDYCITNCKAKVVFSGKEAKNKDIKEYLGVRREDESGSSKNESVLQEEK